MIGCEPLFAASVEVAALSLRFTGDVGLMACQFPSPSSRTPLSSRYFRDVQIPFKAALGSSSA